MALLQHAVLDSHAFLVTPNCPYLLILMTFDFRYLLNLVQHPPQDMGPPTLVLSKSMK
jgi:hypothetical protein